MGQWFKRFFESLGNEVLIASRNTKLTPVECVSSSDIVIISVPINITVNVIKEIGKYVKKDGLLMDLTSIKEEPVNAMLKYSNCEVIGCHPVFGPSTTKIKNQTIVLCPARGKKWHPIITEMFERQSAKVKITTPKKHDEIMAVIQGLTHFSIMSHAYAMKLLKTDINESIEFSSPIYKLRMDMVGRILNQDSEMYADIEIMNKRTREVIKAYIDSAKKLQRIIENGEREAFIRYFKSASDFLGDFREEAEEYSNYIIEKLVEKKER